MTRERGSNKRATLAREDAARSDRTDRRQLLKLACAGVLGAGLLGAGYWRFELHFLEVAEHDLPIAGLPPTLEGALLVQLSDLHVGPAVDDAYVRHAFEMADALKPDILVFTGDFVTWRGPQQLQQLDRVLEAMPRASLARIAILGNHDYGHRWRQAEVADAVAALVTRHGVHVLRNEVRDVEGLRIVGIDDVWARRTDVPKARALVPATSPTLMLCHNPDVADAPVWSDYRGWMLSGHTHGGQVKPPFMSPPVLPVVNKRYAAGQVALADGRTVYINRGIGHTLPIRINVRPEITKFRLVRA